MSDFTVNRNHTKKQDIMKDVKYNSTNNFSAPTELLVEFLSSIMVKDYHMALKHCTDILKRDPNNTTAMEFYPLIVEKLEMIKNEEFDSTSSETSSSSSSISSTSSENIFFHNEVLNTSGNYSNHSKNTFDHTSDDITASNAILSTSESVNIYATSVESSTPLVPKPKSNISSLTKQELNNKITGNITPLPSNLLIHPTRKIPFIGKNASNTSTRTPPRPKEEKQTPTAIKKKPSKLLLHTTPTITFPKRLPPRNLEKVENSQ